MLIDSQPLGVGIVTHINLAASTRFRGHEVIRCRTMVTTLAPANGKALMNQRDGHFGNALTNGMMATLGAFAVVAGATAQAGVAQAAPLFNGTYTAVGKSFTIDPRSGARIDQSDSSELWVVGSSCAIRGCSAHVVKRGEGFDMLFDGAQWTRLAIPLTGICNGATVPARSVTEVLNPQADGSLTGEVGSTVDCAGVAVNSSVQLTLTPS